MAKLAADRISPTSGRVRAIRHDDRDQQLARSSLLLGLSGEFVEFDAQREQRLARALRAARRAAIRGGGDYDPVRHLLLVRHLKERRLPGG